MSPPEKIRASVRSRNHDRKALTKKLLEKNLSLKTTMTSASFRKQARWEDVEQMPTRKIGILDHDSRNLGSIGTAARMAATSTFPA
ncbi:hypothetical protein TIFTF001_027330 [Ficus carica]|uniref:Uncharacterized protein n=1 Tax=Ficus carica TaxID=3494 RepID=A0AA88J049_FICCA|nr:hypothetical protein TIFTF001_027330 [Ficus carica]